MRYIFIVFFIIPITIFASNDLNIDSLKQALDTENDSVRYKVLNRLVLSLYSDSPDEAISYANSILILAESHYNDLWKETAFHLLGVSYESKGDYQTAIKYHQKALQIRTELKDQYWIAVSHEKIASCYRHLTLFNKAMPHLKIALQINTELKNKKKISFDLGRIGFLLKAQEKYEMAIDYYLKSLEISESIGDEENNAYIYNSIGSIYFSMNDYDESLSYYKKALDIRLRINNKFGIAGSLNNIGRVYNKQEKTDTALNYYYRALAINEEIGNLQWKSYNLSNIGIIYKNQGNYSKALEYLKLSLDIKKKRKDSKGFVYSSYQVGSVFLLMKEYFKATEYFEKGLETAEQLNFIKLIAEGNEYLSTAYSKIGKHKLALDYYKIYDKYNDTILNLEKIKAVNEIHIKYKTDKTDKENKILKYEKELLQNETEIKSKYQIILIIIAISFIILSVMLFLLLRSKNRVMQNNRLLFKKEQEVKDLEIKNADIENLRLEELVFAEKKINKLQKEKLELKNRELGTTTLNILNRNQVLSKINQEIKQMQVTKEYDGIACKNIIQMIKGDAAIEKDWEQFKKHFEEIYHEFFDNLSSMFPTLTSYDLKLCAYLRINLNTKEIASMLNVSVAAINKSRNRLRKKLGMNSNKSFVDFFMENIKS